jgi:aspartate kinase
MSIIVQKFGGSSVADSKKILAAARKAIRAQLDGNQVVTVVSAMGDTTDDLLDLAKQITDQPPAREMDMLLSTGEQVSVALMAMAINALGYHAISMTGSQLGIHTDSTHTKARICSIHTERITKELNKGRVVIAAGFQGVSPTSDITTLGRGGSDTTAVALAAVLHADSCEVYTDVDGVYTTDPRLVPSARRMKRISHDEMLELASAGAGVMHNRSIEFAKKFGANVHVRSSFSDQPGTMITTEPESYDQPVCGAALVKDEARVTVRGVPDRPGAALAVFTKIAAKNIGMDMIVQNVAAEGLADISFTVVRDDLPATLKAVEEAVGELGARRFSHDDNVSKVSIVGLGMKSKPGVAQKMFRALANKGINILMITTSDIKISVLVKRENAVEALRTVHAAFELEKEPRPAGDGEGPVRRANNGNTEETVARMQNMEDLLLDGIELDESQARITLPGVPDQPGIAAQVFEVIAADGVVVDMIVQSSGSQGKATVSFTVPQKDLAKSLQTCGKLAKQLQSGEPTSCPNVAKLTVLGTGMKSHTALAARLFQSLATHSINVEMVNTSEVRLNVVVEGKVGRKALETLQNEFADVIV